MGWNWSLQLARFAEVVVITRANNRSVIEAEMEHRGLSNPTFVYYDPPRWVRAFKRGARGLYPFYLAWQWGSYRLAKRLVAERPFSHVLQLTMGSIWLPVFAHRLPGRFVWGPIGGAEGIPPQILDEVPTGPRLLQHLRRLLKLTLPVNPFILGVLSRSDRILVRTRDTLSVIPSRYRDKTTCILETGVSREILDRPAPAKGRRPSEAPTVLFTGRLIGSKNIAMMLHAAAWARDAGSGFRLRIVGDGPERRNLERLVQRLELGPVVEFLGAVPHEAVLQELRAADIYMFPSLREGGSWSLMEAMCAALPVICLDTSGMSVITDDACAVRVAPLSREHIIQGLADGLSALCASPELRARMGRKARERMRDHFLWDRVGEEAGRLVLGEPQPADSRP